MAKIYHNGEYVNGGPTARTINTYYVEISEPTSRVPISIPEPYYQHDGQGNGIREHKLVLINTSNKKMDIPTLHILSSDGVERAYQTKAIVPSYRDLEYYDISVDTMYIKNPPEYMNYTPYISLEPFVSHEFFFNRTDYVQMDRYYTNCIYGSSTDRFIKLYSEQGLRNAVCYPFILTGYSSLPSNSMTPQLTMGTIFFALTTPAWNITQESIIGNSKIENVEIYDPVTGEKIVSPSTIISAISRSFGIKFTISTPTSGSNCRYKIHLFT